MRILCVVTGHYGMRIAAHLAEAAPGGWEIAMWEGPAGVPRVLDDPAPFLPDSLPQAELLLSLAEHPGVSDLAVDLTERCGAEAVIAPIDRGMWLPPGLATQLARRLAARGMGYAFPAPFCSLRRRGHVHPVVERFAAHFGTPELRCGLRGGQLVDWEIVREAPCGCTRFVVEKLAGIDPERAAESAGLLHHYYPCLASMEDTGTQAHPLLHQAAKITQAAVSRAIAEQMVVQERA